MLRAMKLRPEKKLSKAFEAWFQARKLTGLKVPITKPPAVVKVAAKMASEVAAREAEHSALRNTLLRIAGSVPSRNLADPEPGPTPRSVMDSPGRARWPTKTTVGRAKPEDEEEIDDPSEDEIEEDENDERSAGVPVLTSLRAPSANVLPAPVVGKQVPSVPAVAGSVWGLGLYSRTLPTVDARDPSQVDIYQRLMSAGVDALSIDQLQWIQTYQAARIAHEEQLRSADAEQEAKRLRAETWASIQARDQALATQLRQHGKSESDIHSAAPKALAPPVVDEDQDLLEYECTRDNLEKRKEPSALIRRFAESAERVTFLVGAALQVNAERIRSTFTFQQDNRAFREFVSGGLATPLSTGHSAATLAHLVALPVVTDLKKFEIFLGMSVFGEDSIGLRHFASPGMSVQTLLGIRQAVDNLVALCAVVFGGAVRSPFRQPLDELVTLGETVQLVVNTPMVIMWVIDNVMREFWTILRREYRAPGAGEITKLKNLGWAPVWRSLFSTVVFNFATVGVFSQMFEAKYRQLVTASETPSRVEQPRRSESAVVQRSETSAPSRTPRERTGRAQDEARRSQGTRTETGKPRKKLCLQRLAVAAGLKSATDCPYGDACKFVHAFRSMTRADIIKDVSINNSPTYGQNPRKQELLDAVEKAGIGRS